MPYSHGAAQIRTPKVATPRKPDGLDVTPVDRRVRNSLTPERETILTLRKYICRGVHNLLEGESSVSFSFLPLINGNGLSWIF